MTADSREPAGTSAAPPVDIGDFKTPAPPTPNSAEEAVAAFMNGATGDLMADVGAPQDETGLPDVQPDAQPDQEAIAQQLEEAVDAVEQAPEETWDVRLKKMGIDKDEAYQIIDTIMTKGVYTRGYRVTDKVQVFFRTRDFADHERLQNALEAGSPQFMGTVSLIMAKYNLASSLVKYGNREFSVNDKGQPEEAFNFIAKLPYMVFSLLLRKLQLFDELAITVMDEGALENF